MAVTFCGNFESKLGQILQNFYLVIATHHHLGVEDNVEAEDDRPNYCKNQSCGPSLQMAKVIFNSKGKVLILGKHHHKNIAVHLGIAQIAIGPPPPALKRALCGTYFRAKSCKCPFLHGYFS